MLNRTGELRSCAFNNKLKCRYKISNCPLQDLDFVRDLERFLYKGRTPRSIRIDAPTKGQFTADLKRSHFLAINAIVFGGENVPDYDRYNRTGKMVMTYKLCWKWRIAYGKWRTYLKCREL